MQAFDDHGECAGEDVFSLSENSDQQECRLQSRPCMFILNAQTRNSRSLQMKRRKHSHDGWSFRKIRSHKSHPGFRAVGFRV